jgi:hypothetical protein
MQVKKVLATPIKQSDFFGQQSPVNMDMLKPIAETWWAH